MENKMKELLARGFTVKKNMLGYHIIKGNNEYDTQDVEGGLWWHNTVFMKNKHKRTLRFYDEGKLEDALQQIIDIDDKLEA